MFAQTINHVGGNKIIVEANYKESGIEFITQGAKLAFGKLRQAFNTASILHYFDPKYHISNEIDASSYVIDKIFPELTSDDTSQCYPNASFFWKTIPP